MKDETRVREEYEKKLSDPAFLIQRLAEITGAEVVLSKPPEPEEPKPETEPDPEIPVEVEDDGDEEGVDEVPATNEPAPDYSTPPEEPPAPLRSRSKKR